MVIDDIFIYVYLATIKPELRRPPSQALPIQSPDTTSTKIRSLFHSQSESEVIHITMAGEGTFLFSGCGCLTGGCVSTMVAILGSQPGGPRFKSSCRFNPRYSSSLSSVSDWL